MPSDNTISIAPNIPGPDVPVEPTQAAEPKLPSEGEAPKSEPQVTQQTPSDAPGSQEQDAHDVLAAAGLKYESLEAEWAESGQISEASYAALEKAGYSKKLVDTFIAGMGADAVKAQVLQEKEVDSIKATVGGAEAYTKLTRWATENMAPAELDGYNAIMATNNVDAIKMAVQNLQGRYESVMGRDPKFVNSQGSAPAPRDVYESLAEASRDMKDPRYSKDPAYIKKVTDKLLRSNL